MKKISVNKLIQLFRDEDRVSADCMYYRNNEGAFCKQRLAELTERLQKIREDIKTESVRLTQAIADAEGKRVSVRKIDARDVIKDLIAVDDYLRLTKKSMKGSYVYVNHCARHFPNSYRFGYPQSTWFKAEYTNGWCITNIYRDACGNNKYLVYLSDSAKLELLQNAMRLK